MRKLLKRIAIGGGIFFAAILIGGTGFLWYLDFFEPPDWSRLEDSREASIIYDEDGGVLKEYCTYCREIIPLEAMGRFPDFTIAAEDKDFWKRSTPISFRGMFRAFLHNLLTRSATQGGSTISQQVARNIFAEKELLAEREAEKTGTDVLQKKIWRKERELWLAIRLEGRLDRKKILELYLNTSYMGNGCYGIKSCARLWFTKDPTELNPAEAAWLVGLLRTPRLAASPNKQTAQELRNRVLDQFAKESALTKVSPADTETWKAYPMPNRLSENRNPAPHFTEYVRRLITKKTQLVDQGLRIQTTLNREWQKATSDALAESIVHMQERNPELTDLWGAAILIHAQSGAIKAFAQYPSYRENQFLIDQIKRQCGSTCKPFFYTAWLEQGGRFFCKDEGTGPCRLADIPGLRINMGSGKSETIQNFPYPKPMKLYTGMAEPLLCIAESRNACTMSGVEGVGHSPIKLSERVSKETMLRLMARLRIKPGTIDSAQAQSRGVATIKPDLAKELKWSRDTVDPGLTLPIGSVDISPLDMVRAWTGFMGILTDPYAIEDIRDGKGERINAELERKEPATVFEENVRLQMLRGLRATVEFPHGTAKRARIGCENEKDEKCKKYPIPKLTVPVMGKTGTADSKFLIDGKVSTETTDNWFIGCTPSYCMAIWIGRENKLPMKTTIDEHTKEKIQEAGGTNALPVFIKTMHAIYKDKDVSQELFPELTDPLKPFRPSEQKKKEEITENPEESEPIIGY